MIVYVKDLENEMHSIEFKRLEYPSLMELIFNTYYTEMGECKGRGLCGTCVIEIIEGYEGQSMKAQERETLHVNDIRDKKYRLACQILLDDKINGAVFKEL